MTTTVAFKFYHVSLCIYDLTKGLAKLFSPLLPGSPIGAIYHSSVCVSRSEYFFSSRGIIRCEPGHSLLGKPDRVIYIGRVFTSKHLLNDWLASQRGALFAPDNYRLLTHNCNTFSDHFLFWLTGKRIPDFIKNQVTSIRKTHYGDLWLSLIDALKA